MEDKKQLSINLTAQIISFAVGFIISFFIAPFVIGKLGEDAYGFIGLANNFVSYTTLITIALNSMAGRFITISYHKGDAETAKKYFASVYYSNLFLSGVIILFAIFIVVFLDRIVKIPPALDNDVKFLFGLTFLNSIFALISNFYSVAAFVKNRIDLHSLRSIVSNLVRLVCILTPFLLFKPHLWYYGISALIATTYFTIANRSLTRKLLPELRIDKSLFDFKLVKELLVSGGWNLLTKLSEVLSAGMDLLLANLFISATAMGTLAIGKTVPMAVLFFCGSIIVVFVPKLTELYAKGNIVALRNELLNNIRITGVFSAIPLVVFMVLGEDFFRLWVPMQDARILYVLSSVALFNLLLSTPQESLWNVFVIVNKVKTPAIIRLIFSILIFATILIAVFCCTNEYYKLLSIVGARAVWEGVRSLTFLPIYGAKCLNLKWTTFYFVIFKNLFLLILLIIVLGWLKRYIVINDWIGFILYAVFISAVTGISIAFFMLNKDQKLKLFKMMKKLC
jgi:O-antigen/teichoic acid export membrane protein